MHVRSLLSSCVTAAALAAALAACMVFDESMRRTRAGDAGDPTGPGTTASGGPTGTAAPTGTASPSCTLVVASGTGVSGCGGVGGAPYTGRDETEPNNAVPQVLAREDLVCGAVSGADVDVFELAVQSGDCFEIVVDLSSGAEATISGDGRQQTLDTSAQLPFRAGASGSFLVRIRATAGAATYRVLAR